ncbi:hypothetical protein Dimus_038628 [Dionaea muscipula]
MAGLDVDDDDSDAVILSSAVARATAPFLSGYGGCNPLLWFQIYSDLTFSSPPDLGCVFRSSFLDLDLILSFVQTFFLFDLICKSVG